MSRSPCGACKHLGRKCTLDSLLAPYLPTDGPTNFAIIHRVFGNVEQILNQLDVSQRENAVNSLAYEAESRLRRPVHGCVHTISELEQELKALQTELTNATQELAVYMDPQTVLPNIQLPPQPQPPAYMGNVEAVPLSPAPGGPSGP